MTMAEDFRDISATYCISIEHNQYIYDKPMSEALVTQCLELARWPDVWLEPSPMCLGKIYYAPFEIV